MHAAVIITCNYGPTTVTQHSRYHNVIISPQSCSIKISLLHTVATGATSLLHKAENTLYVFTSKSVQLSHSLLPSQPRLQYLFRVMPAPLSIAYHAHLHKTYSMLQY